MNTLKLHGIQFNVADEIDVTDELKADLDARALKRFAKPVEVVATSPGRCFARYAADDDVAGKPSYTATVEGHDVRIVLMAAEGTGLPEWPGKDAMAAVRDLVLSTAYVGPWDGDGEDPGYYVDFD